MQSPAVPEHRESEFTDPKPACPHPELWRAYDNMAAELEVGEFLYGLVRIIKPALVVELGTGRGRTLWHMARAVAANEYGRCVGVEPISELGQQARLYCEPYPIVSIIPSEPRDYRPSAPIDLLFLDSEPAGERWDILRRLLPHISGFVAIHDTPGVGAVGASGWEAIYFPCPRGLSLFRRSSLLGS